MNHASLVWMFGVLFASGAIADDAVVYRWKDRDGRVNYGNLPPPGVRAEPLDARGRLTVVPAPIMPPRPAPSDPSEAERLERLERELETERARRLERDEAERERAALQSECEARYREPCDVDGQPVGRRYIVVPVRPPHRPPVLRPPRPPGEVVPERPGASRPGAPGRDERPPYRLSDDASRSPRPQPETAPRRRAADDVTRPDDRRPVPP